jgi:hypothetical protein
MHIRNVGFDAPRGILEAHICLRFQVSAKILGQKKTQKDAEGAEGS